MFKGIQRVPSVFKSSVLEGEAGATWYVYFMLVGDREERALTVLILSWVASRYFIPASREAVCSLLMSWIFNPVAVTTTPLRSPLSASFLRLWVCGAARRPASGDTDTLWRSSSLVLLQSSGPLTRPHAATSSCCSPVSTASTRTYFPVSDHPCDER